MSRKTPGVALVPPEAPAHPLELRVIGAAADLASRLRHPRGIND
jgi:hypothetical protein